MELPRYRSQALPQVATISPWQAGAGAAAMGEALARGLDVTARVSSMIGQAESEMAADADLAEIRVRTREFLSDPRWELPEIDGKPTDEVLASEWEKRERELSGLGSRVRDRQAKARFDAGKRLLLESARTEVVGAANKVRVERGRSLALEAADKEAQLGNWAGVAGTFDRAVESGLMTAAERLQGRERYASVMTDRLIDQDPRAVIEALQKEPGKAGNPVIDSLSAAGRNVALNRAQAEVRRLEAEERARQAELRAAQQAQSAALKDYMDDAMTAFSMGFGLPSDYGDVRTAIQSLPAGDPRRSRMLRMDAVMTSLDRSGFLTMTPAQQQEAITGFAAQIQAGEPNPVAIEILRTAQTISAEAERQMKVDPFAFAVRRGVAPLPQSTGDAAADLKARADAGRKASAYLGVDVPGFTAQELTTIAENYERADVDGRMALLAALTDSHGQARATTVFAALDKKGHAGMAFAGALALDSPEAARLVVKGQKALAEGGKAVADLKVKFGEDYKAELLPVLGDAYGLGTSARNTVEQAVLAAYVAQSIEAGDTSGQIDGDRLERAVEAVTGGIVEFQGRRMPAPLRGVTQGQFNDWARALTPADFQGVAGLTPERAFELFQRDGWLEPVGPNQMVPVVPSVDGRGRFLTREGGDPLSLSYDGRTPVFGSDLADIPERAWR